MIKKIIKLLLISSSAFLLFKNMVKAKNFELELSPEKVTYIIEKGVHKFQLYFYLVRDTENHELVYCLEPGVALSNEEYEALKEIEYTKLNLNQETIDYITKVAYFGYNQTNHLNRNYYYAAQLLIWQKIIPDDWSIYYTNGLGGNKINPYLNEQQEIEKLIEEDKQLPDFANQTFTWNKIDSLNLKDNTNTIDKYQIVKDENVNLIQDKNKLEIKVDNDQEVTIEFQKNYEGEPLQFYYHKDGQNVLKKGALPPQKFYLYLKPFETKVEIQKMDEENKVLPNIQFRLLNQNTKEEIAIYQTNDEGEILIKDLALGKYCLEEKNTPNDYYPLSKEVCFELSKEKTTLKIPIINHSKKTKLIIQKIDADTKESLSKVRFQIWSKDKCIFDGLTNELGILEIENLKNGEYKIIEIETIDGYLLEKEPRVVKIDGNNPTLFLTIENRKLEKVPNTIEHLPLDLLPIIDNEERKKKK